MMGKIISLALAIALIGLLSGCDIGDRRLPPNYRLERTPDPSVTDDDGYRRRPPNRRNNDGPGSQEFPTPTRPGYYDDDQDDDRYYDDRRRNRGRRNSSRDRVPPRFRDRDQDQDQDRYQDQDRDRPRPRESDRSEFSPTYNSSSAVNVSIILGKNNKSYLADNKLLDVRTAKTTSGGEIINVSARDRRTVNFSLIDHVGNRTTVSAKSLNLRVNKGGTVMGVDN
ncbi:MAG: hypothetical protein LBT86_08870 [Deltaproteobacteria bacterium]|jgi:hypothetical protein|nr:hypothetical protein [Deltaproteobacteria bacterium]